MVGKLFRFGWVASNIQGDNLYGWSSDKGEGTLEEAQAFYLETYPQYKDKQGIEWFCYPADDPTGVYNVEIVRCS